MTAITFAANAVTDSVAGPSIAATENTPQSKGLFTRMLRAIERSRMESARLTIVNYAHLLPEGLKAADVLPFVASDQSHLN